MMWKFFATPHKQVMLSVSVHLFHYTVSFSSLPIFPLSPLRTSKVSSLPKFISTKCREMSVESTKNLKEIAKLKAAYLAVDEHIKDGQIVGIGSGSTVVYAVDRIVQKVKEENLKIICIPTSFQAKELIVSNGLQLSDLDLHFPVDVTIDGCDECDTDLNVIKGGGGCLLQEKIVAAASRKLIIIADYTKDSKFLGENWKKGIPLEVSQIGHKVVLSKLNRFTESQNSQSTLRPAVSKMGPVVTDNSNFIIDFAFGAIFREGSITSTTPDVVEKWLKTVPGILETGLFINMAESVYFGMKDGTVTKRINKKQPNVFLPN